MGFHLWTDGEVAWAQGSYEYRPMGAAVISSSDLFKRRDFSARRAPPRPGAAVYVGQFASIGQLNQELRRRRPRAKRPLQVAAARVVGFGTAVRVSGRKLTCGNP